jgi:hypothetical protein
MPNMLLCLWSYLSSDSCSQEHSLITLNPTDTFKLDANKFPYTFKPSKSSDNDVAAAASSWEAPTGLVRNEISMAFFTHMGSVLDRFSMTRTHMLDGQAITNA